MRGVGWFVPPSSHLTPPPHFCLTFVIIGFCMMPSVPKTPASYRCSTAHPTPALFILPDHSALPYYTPATTFPHPPPPPPPPPLPSPFTVYPPRWDGGCAICGRTAAPPWPAVPVPATRWARPPVILPVLHRPPFPLRFMPVLVRSGCQAYIPAPEPPPPPVRPQRTCMLHCCRAAYMPVHMVEQRCGGLWCARHIPANTLAFPTTPTHLPVPTVS